MSDNFDLIIENGSAIDGTRAPRFEAEVGVRGGRCARSPCQFWRLTAGPAAAPQHFERARPAGSLRGAGS